VEEPTVRAPSASRRRFAASVACSLRVVVMTLSACRSTSPATPPRSGPDAGAFVDVPPIQDTEPVDVTGDVPSPPDSSGVDGSQPDAARAFPMPPAVEPGRMGWALTDAGTWIAAATPGLLLVYDRAVRDPTTVFARCSAMIRYCATQPGRALDDCVADAPRCATVTPWMEDRDCCPDSCRARFASLRAAGRDAFGAFVEVFAQRPDCFPGLTDAGGP
jgi:hypothetical protein